MGTLHSTLCSAPWCDQVGSIELAEAYYQPAFWVLLAARMRAMQLGAECVTIRDMDVMGYADAIGFWRALGGDDGYAFERRNLGRKYSCLECLSDEQSAERAHQNIAGCLRSMVTEPAIQPIIGRVSDLVGELHDNVVSHAGAPGFSMAQRFGRGANECLIFAIADLGIGFLGELRRCGIEVGDHEDAIRWCIEAGHTTKAPRARDEWAQRMPDDMMNNPLRGVERIRQTDNSHAGLGLHKLVQASVLLDAEIEIATGDKTLYVGSQGYRAFWPVQVNRVDATDGGWRVSRESRPWQGVAVACKFSIQGLERLAANWVEDDQVDRIMDLLTGERDE